MYDLLYQQLTQRKTPIDVIVIGLGFVSFGFISASRNLKGLRVPLVITRRPDVAKDFLTAKGFSVMREESPKKIRELAAKGYISVTDNLDLIREYENELVIEMTGTVPYATEAALRTLYAGKHLVTMNPELQATVGSELKAIAREKGLLITDVLGDQPGCLSRLIYNAKLMGFKPLVAGNMKRYMDHYATKAKMQLWADNKGVSVRQIVSFTDGTKQAIEMNLVANFFEMNILRPGMKGVQLEDIRGALQAFASVPIPVEGVVDYAIGLKLFPGVFLIGEHVDPHQYQYLRYLNMGEGPRYLLFDAYHLCHLEVAITIAKVALFKQETIHNSLHPKTKTIAIAKRDLHKGEQLDGIGGDLVYGDIYKVEDSEAHLPIGLTDRAILREDVAKDQPIKISAVELPVNAATILAGLIPLTSKQQPVYKFQT